MWRLTHWEMGGAMGEWEGRKEDKEEEVGLRFVAPRGVGVGRVWGEWGRGQYLQQ